MILFKIIWIIELVGYGPSLEVSSGVIGDTVFFQNPKVVIEA